MKRTVGFLAGLAIAGLFLAGAPGAAFATPPSPEPSGTPTPAASGAPRTPVPPDKEGAKGVQMADGNVYVWGDMDFTGLWCYWSGHHRVWQYAWNSLYGSPGTCLTKSHSFNDVASSMWNNGFPGEYAQVRFYRDIGQEGPSMCLANGEDWGNLGLGWELFNDGTNANDQISSHMWVNSC
ncbi:peptidase inhibitor family I36 protein [Nonomuraea jiangxiensis]|uniref:Peptidase inhibitor family I36 n=1 Tax=Nonomuraea jiangxiensis TaxID=633440 RepID=A0A1G8QR34_9ACTN|nr:peptidase inhibitor family I36 protein [Nonomuraea jiangxiensis]SDJ07184.1 Peptidase inhibitor family I36 [Nonomuraea jiangxiensis]